MFTVEEGFGVEPLTPLVPAESTMSDLSHENKETPDCDDTRTRVEGGETMTAEMQAAFADCLQKERMREKEKTGIFDMEIIGSVGVPVSKQIEK